MSKELNFGDGYDEVKYLDNSTNFDLVLTTDGIAFDLRQADEITVKIANDSGYIMSKDIDLSTITNPENGEFLLPIDDSIMSVLVPDDYYIEVWLKVNPVTPVTDDQSVTLTVDNDSLEERQSIFPSSGLIGFTIDENINSDTGEVIPVITFDQFQDKFNDMMAQMQNVVSNVKKGDKGDKGDTGQGLEIKDRVSSVSNLPSTANEGDGYLVGEELYVRVNNAWKDCGPLQGPKGPQGIQGIQGKTGVGISSTAIQYQISNSVTTTPTGTWSNTLIATTQANPFLWTQVTLSYDDGTSKSFYLVSSKGDKGDKGDTGATGPVGPQGPVGAGLVVKGTVNSVSQLPTTGNQEGYCYFIGTDLYVWDAGAWKNCGSVSPDLSNYVTVTDLNNGLSTKVTDNKNGTIQVNGTQVSPYNKLSDTIGGRNLAPNTSDDWQKVSVSDGWGPVNLSNKIYEIKDGETYTVQVEVRNMTSTIMLETFNFTAAGARNGLLTPHAYVSDDTKIIITFTAKLPENYAYFQPDLAFSQKLTSAGSYEYRRFKLEKGSVATDWCPNPEDKVNVVDMRKPASDVAGIEEVNAKADDSKVAHLSGANNFDAVPTVNNNPLLLASSLPSDLARTSQQTNFTNGLQSGGVDVATAADLKSVEDQAWRPIISNNYSGLCMMKYNADTETMSLSGTIFPKTYSTEGSRVSVIIPLPDGFSMGENTDSKTTIWTNATGTVQNFAGIVADLKYESDGIHIIFDKIYSNYPDPKMFIILDDFFAYSTANPQSNNLINFKVTKN